MWRGRQWLDEQTYVDLVALCQFLPRPASSQVGIAVGIFRACQAARRVCQVTSV
jgi:chromate transporter